MVYVHKLDRLPKVQGGKALGVQSAPTPLAFLAVNAWLSSPFNTTTGFMCSVRVRAS